MNGSGYGGAVVLGALCAPAMFPAPLLAQNYPAKPVRIIVPFGPGGGTDVQARVLGKHLQDLTTQPFIVDNRAGASGLIGAEIVVNAPPDGYTVLITTATLAIVPTFMGSQMKFQPMKDLAPVIQVSTTPMVLIVHPSVPARSPREFIALAKSRPGIFNAAINVPGSTSHLSAEMLKQLASVRFTVVPYKSGGLSMVATMGGEVDFQFAEGVLAMPQINAGKVRALAVTTPEPVAFFPKLPTMNAVLPGLVSDNWFAFFLPAATSKDIVIALNTAIRKTLETKEVRALFDRDALVARGGTPEDLAAHLKSETTRFADIIRKGNITLQ
jgi:tripartite-type tricarboxylate transporter receptor subunit TctC